MELSISIGWFECQHPSKDFGIDFKRFFGEVKKMKYKFPLTLELNPGKCLGIGERSDIKSWGPTENNSNIEKSLRAAARMFHKYYDAA